ncbi:MAG TPA: adenylate/guanylate cyclase domain-containing protein [Verrucomicrobiae bacterium]|jgi:adenylate cyclase|nr:adenylate/guanylate cyclase domain-containing protein [Verrucomicrobiae bacterium]
MNVRARTLTVALLLSLLGSAAGIVLYSVDENTLPIANRVGDYIIHQNALANAGVFLLPHAPSYQDPDPSLALIQLDEESYKGDPTIGLPAFPYPRGVYGPLLDKLAQAGARVAVFDIQFLEPSADPSQDARLAAAMHKMPTVLDYVFGTTAAGQTGLELPPPDLGPAAVSSGYGSTDAPGSYFIGQRQVITTGATGTYANQRFTSLAAAAVERFTGKRLGTLPTDADGRLLFLPIQQTTRQSLTGRVGSEESTIPIAQGVSLATALTEPIAELRPLVSGKIVLIGATAQASSDFAPTAAGRIYGVYMNARYIDQLLTGTFITVAPNWLDILLIVLLPLLLGLALAELRPTYGIVVSLVAVVVYVEFAVAIYVYHLYLVDLIHVAGAMLLATLFGGLYRVLKEGAQRKMVTDMFGMHVSPAVVKEILKNEDPRSSLSLRGTRVRVTVFYSDIRGFTSMSETMTPEEIYAQLNEYFDAMCKLVFKYGGYVDKFIGDCIMAVFSAPFQTPQDAKNAVISAFEQQQMIAKMSQEWIAQGKHAFTVGMGVNTGDVVMGNLGASSRMNYTVIGDNVNVAARLYNVAKGGEIVISDATYQEVKDVVEVVEMEPVMVKGKSIPIRIYNIVGLKNPPA